MGWRAGFRKFGENCSGICRATHNTVNGKKCSPHTVLVIEGLYGYSLGFSNEEASTSELYSHSQFSHMLFTDVGSVENK